MNQSLPNVSRNLDVPKEAYLPESLTRLIQLDLHKPGSLFPHCGGWNILSFPRIHHGLHPGAQPSDNAPAVSRRSHHSAPGSSYAATTRFQAEIRH